MNKTLTIFFALLCAVVVVMASTSSKAQGLHPRVLTPQEKQASDANMTTGLQQEQAALAAMGQNGGASTAAADLQAAVAAMHQARPIYHGHRVRSMGIAAHAAKELGITPKNPAKAAARITAKINQAITEAQTALSVSSNVETPEDRELPRR
jgi:hypothetical protein